MLDKSEDSSYFVTAMSKTLSDGEKPTGSEHQNSFTKGRYGNETLNGQPANRGMAGNESEAEMVHMALSLPASQTADQSVSAFGWSLAVVIGLLLWALLFSWVL